MHKRKGFTLIELLVVIAIISLLMAMLVPALERVRKQARKIVCQSNLHQWGVIWKMFVDDNGGMFTEDLGWVEPLAPYYSRDPKVMLCPMAAIPKKVGMPYGYGGIRGGKFHAWEDDNAYYQRRITGSYGYNFWLTRSYAGTRTPGRCWETPNVKGNFQIPVLVDSAGGGLCPWHKDTPPLWDGQIYMSSPMNINEIRNACIDRHDGTINGVFANWSVRSIGLKELWEVKWHATWYEDGRAPPAEFYDRTHWMYPMKNYVRQ